MVTRYTINSRGARYADFERSRLWISPPSELWLVGDKNCRLVMSTAPGAWAIVTAQFAKREGGGATILVSAQIRAVFKVWTMGATVQLLSLGENPYMDEVSTTFDRAGEAEWRDEDPDCSKRSMDGGRRFAPVGQEKSRFSRARLDCLPPRTAGRGRGFCQVRFEAPRETKFLLKIAYW